MPTEDKRRGKLLPSPVVPPDTVCFTIQIPNAVQYRAAFLGQLDVLGDWHTWDHPIDGTECVDCETAAQLWRNALYNAVWSDECGGEPMSCEDVADCIETSEAVQDAIDEHILNSQELSERLRDLAAIPTVPASKLATNFGDVEDCNPDLLFNVTTIAVDTLDEVSKDLFELVLTGVNALERAEILVSAIPFVGDLLPFPEIIEAATNIATSFGEAYNTAFTESLEDDIRCGLFCAHKDTCEMTIADMIAWYENALGHSMPQDIVEAGQDILDFVWLGTLSGDTVVYGMHLLVLAMVRMAQNVAGIKFADIALRLVAAGDDPNNDWTVLCEECPPAPRLIDLVRNFPAIWDNEITYIGKDGDDDVYDVTAALEYGTNAPPAINVRDDNYQCFTIQSWTVSGGTETTYASGYCGGGITSGDGVPPPEIPLVIWGQYASTAGTTFRIVVRPA